MSAEDRYPDTVGRWTRPGVVLFSLLLIAFVLRAFIALHAPNLYYPDEIFQTQEPAHRLAFGNGIVSWEWRDGIRSYVFPFFLAVVMRSTVWMGAGSSGYLTSIVLLMVMFSLTSVWFCYRWAFRVSGPYAGLIAGATAAIWFLLIFFASKTLTEVVASDCLLPGLLIGTEKGGNIKRCLAMAGCLLGLTACLRPQLVPVVVVAGVWMCWADLRGRVPALLLGALVPIVLFGTVDAFTLQFPFASFIRYFQVNVSQGKSKQYGTEPWSFYVRKLLLYCWPMSLPALLGLKKSPLLGWLLLTLVASHSVLAHKEFRFVYTAIPLIVALFGIGCVEAVNVFSSSPRPFLFRALASGAICFIAFTSWTMGRHFTHWHDSAGQVLLGNMISRDDQICGIGYYNLRWAWTSGYTHVHRNIPMVYAATPNDLVRDATQFNILLTTGRISSPPEGFTLANCNFETCTYKRPGICASPGSDELNQYVRRVGQ